MRVNRVFILGSFLFVVGMLLLGSVYISPTEVSGTTYVKGIDVSHWQGSIDWQAVYSDGYYFAYIKASEGVLYTDPEFVNNMNGATAAGLYAGAYHFARPDNNAPEDEAIHFVNVAGEYITTGYLRPVLDLEVGSSMGWSALSDWALRWLQKVTELTGVEPIIYTGAYYASNLESYLTSYDLWIAHWTGDPTGSPNTGVWSTWTFWQYTEQGTVQGISGNVDLDVFNGNLESLVEQCVINGSELKYSHELVFEVTATALNVRTGPSTSYSKIGQVLAGQKYVAFDQVQNGELTWYKFWFDGREAWCAATGYTKVMPYENVVTTRASSLRVRSGPGTSYSIIGYMHSGEKYVKVEGGRWYHVWFGGQDGYAYSSYMVNLDVPVDNYLVFEVTATALNVRTGPSTSYSKIGQILTGQKYVITDVVLTGSLTWYKFWFNGQEAWCAATGYTKIVPFENVFEVTTSTLNVRNGPSTAHTTIGQIHQGELYVKYESSGTWFRFWFEGRSDAWCHSGYVKLVF